MIVIKGFMSLPELVGHFEGIDFKWFLVLYVSKCYFNKINQVRRVVHKKYKRTRVEYKFSLRLRNGKYGTIHPKIYSTEMKTEKSILLTYLVALLNFHSVHSPTSRMAEVCLPFRVNEMLGFVYVRTGTMYRKRLSEQ